MVNMFPTMYNHMLMEDGTKENPRKKKVVLDSMALILSTSFNSDFLELSMCLDLTEGVSQPLGLREKSLLLEAK